MPNLINSRQKGSIIGPLLFVLYINDICVVCTSYMKLYADDAKMYRKIKSRQDVHTVVRYGVSLMLTT